jgi:hypothetical protein
MEIKIYERHIVMLGEDIINDTKSPWSIRKEDDVIIVDHKKIPRIGTYENGVFRYAKDLNIRGPFTGYNAHWNRIPIPKYLKKRMAILEEV